MRTESLGVRSYVLVGAPNSGKTTLYNLLTGSQFKTVNYPGSTVDYCMGFLSKELSSSGPDYEIEIFDTPGTYSLFPKSEDEQVTQQVLLHLRKWDRVVLVLDGTQAERQLQLFQQLSEAGVPLLVVVTMRDLLERVGLKIETGELQMQLGVPVFEVNGLSGEGVLDLVKELRGEGAAFPRSLVKGQKRPPSEASSTSISLPLPWTLGEAQDRKRIRRQWLQAAGYRPQELEKLVQPTRQWDRILLHRYAGLPIFFIAMMGVFVSLFWLASPFMEFLDQGFSWVAEWVFQGAGETLLADFAAHGLIMGFAAVLVFTPQIFILFWLLGALESSGYLARAATLVDRPLSYLGLSGRSFVPLLSGFACAVPALMASRNLSSKRDRLITNMVIPLMTCSARIPVYSLMVMFLFQKQGPLWQGLAMSVLYLLALFFGGLAAGVLNKILPREAGSLFVMELPLYRRPKISVLFSQALSRTKSYVKRAGPIIFSLSVLIWLGTNFPNNQFKESEGRLENSYMGMLGQKLDPVFEPMGLDWRVGVGLMSAFAAREVFVSSMAVLFRVTETDPETQQSGLLEAMSEARNADGGPLFTGASVAGILVFFMIALQCLSTVATSAQENSSWRLALLQLLGLNLVAYILAVVTYQGLNAIFSI